MNKGTAGSFVNLFKLAAAALAVLFFTSGCAGGKAVKVSDRQKIPFPDLVKKISASKIVFVGEMHDVKWHHQVQLKIIKALHKAGVPVAIGMEMFTAGSQKDLDQWVAGKMDKIDFMALYYGNWHIPWEQYKEILLYAKEKKIPIVGLNVPKEIIHQVVKDGYKSLTPEQMKETPEEVKCDIDPEYEGFIKDALDEHDIKDISFQNFCEAQMVWDVSMARNAVNYIQKNPDKLMVVLAGSGHSWKRGAPKQVASRSELPYLVILPELPHKLDLKDVTLKDADYVWIAPWIDF